MYFFFPGINTEPGVGNRDSSNRNSGYLEDSDHEMETTISAEHGMATANQGKTASESGDGKRDSIITQDIEPNPECREDSEHEMKIKFSTFKPEDEMATANSLYQSASGVTVVAGPKAVANPLYESANTVTGNFAE